MKKRSIYQNRSQELYALFESASNNSKIMCIPMDYRRLTQFLSPKIMSFSKMRQLILNTIAHRLDLTDRHYWLNKSTTYR